MKIPLRKAVWHLLWTTCLICGTAAAGLAYYKDYRWRRAHDQKYRLVAIVQTCPERESLKTAYLSELLNLSIDSPVNLYQYSCRAATKTLLKSPLIRDATVAKIYPGALYIDYRLRTPVAFLADYSNTALDKEGTPIPFKPFFTPKKLPEIHLGLNPDETSTLWGNKPDDQRLPLAMDLLDLASTTLVNARCRIRRIDVSRAFAPSFGQREVIIVLEELIEKQVSNRPALVVAQRILRLNSDTYPNELKRFKKLHAQLSASEAAVVDMRIPHLAFIKNEMEKI